MENEELTAEQIAGREVARLRGDVGMTQADLARRLSARGVEMHQTTVAKLEAGRRPIRLNELVVLAQILGVSLESLLPKSGAPSPLEAARAEAREKARRVEVLTTHLNSARAVAAATEQQLAQAEAEFSDALHRLEAESARHKTEIAGHETGAHG
ncbi:helix-turn-helix transcriptional regulator [Nocardioides sp. J2M5]|uniref:helix-turn-helix domain-containing protein n=1 Tax=Nocardioides palaemonis TaxID=2829810 RepID=UPI001BA78DED|nr:helix-turn-helix transcriptional regulator [Nocardioides palaemonis]MBS2939576.1 helix-turn-helix transcriptional regulator [Nocardioides palaemonis]